MWSFKKKEVKKGIFSDRKYPEFAYISLGVCQASDGTYVLQQRNAKSTDEIFAKAPSLEGILIEADNYVDRNPVILKRVHYLP